jgi:hypothetical protein
MIPGFAQDTPPAWKLTLRPARPGAVFDVAEEPRVITRVRNEASAEPAATLRLQVQDADGKVLHTGQADVSVPRGEERSVELSLGPAAGLPHEEYLQMVVTLSAGGVKQAEWRKGFGFLPPRPPIPAQRGGKGTEGDRGDRGDGEQGSRGAGEQGSVRVGTGDRGQRITDHGSRITDHGSRITPASPFGLLAEGDWPLLQRLGVRCVRPNWSWAERPMEWAQRYGIAYCPLINEANLFATGRMEAEEYAAFVRESVEKFKHYVHYWQLGNEFDIFHRDGPAKYVEAQRIGYEAAKAADPECVVIGGSITELQVRPEGFREALQAGLSRYCDIYDFHFYSSLAVTQQMLDFIHARLAEFHAEKPIWVTETTQVGIFDPDDANQAGYVFKRYTHLLANGVRVVFWHALRWPYPFEADKVQATALIDYEGFARPGLFAFAALTRELTPPAPPYEGGVGAAFVRRWDLGPEVAPPLTKGGPGGGETQEGRGEVYALEFSAGGRSRLALWSEGEPQELRLTIPAGPVFVTRPTGRKSPVPVDNGLLRVTAGREAVIFDLPGAVSSTQRSGSL